MGELLKFFVAVTAGIVANLVSKWLDSYKKKR